MSDLYRIDETVLDNYFGFDFGYAEEIGVLVKVEPTVRACTDHDHMVPLEWESCLEGDEYEEECHMVDLVRVEDE